MCKPRNDVNMRTLTLDRAEELAAGRSVCADSVTSAVRTLANVEDPMGRDLESRPIRVPDSTVSTPFAIWDYSMQHVLLKPEPGIELPATCVVPAADSDCSIVHFDDDGRDRLLVSGGMLTHVIGFMGDGSIRRSVLSVDLRGCGNSAPCTYPYDLAGWGSPDRCVSYLSAELGDSVLGMRIRDGLSSVSYAREDCSSDTGRMIVSGCGLGGVVALHVAAADPSVGGVVVWDCLSSFAALLREEYWSWPAVSFFPNVLLHYDIPELVSSLRCPVRIVRPLDGAGRGLDDETISELNRSAGRDIYVNGPDEVIKDAFSQVSAGAE